MHLSCKEEIVSSILTSSFFFFIMYTQEYLVSCTHRNTWYPAAYSSLISQLIDNYLYTTKTTHPWDSFSSSIARQPRGCQYRTIRLRKALGEMFPTPTFLAPALFQLWRYRPWKIGPGGCDIRTIIYGSAGNLRRASV